MPWLGPWDTTCFPRSGNDAATPATAGELRHGDEKAADALTCHPWLDRHERPPARAYSLFARSHFGFDLRRPMQVGNRLSAIGRPQSAIDFNHGMTRNTRRRAGGYSELKSPRSSAISPPASSPRTSASSQPPWLCSVGQRMPIPDSGFASRGTFSRDPVPPS